MVEKVLTGEEELAKEIECIRVKNRKILSKSINIPSPPHTIRDSIRDYNALYEKINRYMISR